MACPFKCLIGIQMMVEHNLYRFGLLDEWFHASQTRRLVGVNNKNRICLKNRVPVAFGIELKDFSLWIEKGVVLRSFTVIDDGDGFSELAEKLGEREL